MAKSESSGSNLPNLFNELSRHGEDGDWEKGLKVIEKILKEAPKNPKALHCKAVCLIQKGSFKEAIKIINSLSSTVDLQYEKAYCQYRLKNANEAIKTLDAIKEPDFKVKELRAQALYRLERYQDCYQTYLDLIKNSEDEYEDERGTNLAALLASLSLDNDQQTLKNSPEIKEETFELCYNKACVLLGQGNIVDALKLLNQAEELCRKVLEEEGSSEEEITSELGIIRAQIGYCYQLQSKNEVALRMYNQVLKQATDSAVVAVTSNNVVAIHKGGNVFDSKKRMKTAVAEMEDSNLSTSQKQSIVFNNCLLLMHTNQNDSCRKKLAELKSRFPDSLANAVLVEAALLCKEKKVKDAVEVLKNYSSKHPEQSIEIAFTLAQLLIGQKHFSQACEVLRNLGEISQRPGVISTLVTLYLHEDNKEAVVELLRKSIAWYKKNKPSSPDILNLYRENARHLMDMKKPEEAVSLLEELRKSNSSPRVLALLISAYSQIDAAKAQQISRELPPLDDVIASVDIETLENSNWSLGAKYVKKTTKADPSPGDVKVTKTKKKKKRKKRFPKNYDPTVDPDPERWLPRYQRSTYKKKKDKRGGGVGKGTQGAVGEIDLKPTVAKATPAAATASPQGPRQQRPSGQKARKKKGGKR